MDIFVLSISQMIVSTIGFVAIYYRLICKSIPFSGTLSIELLVSLFAFIIWVYTGEVRVRDMMLCKVITIPFIAVLSPNRRSILKRLLKVFSKKYTLLNISIFLTAVVYLFTLISKSLINSLPSEDILIAIYVISAPLQGYLISRLLDEYKNDLHLKPFTIFLVGIPALIFLMVSDVLALERIVLGSQAVGGLYSHFAIICLLLSRKKGLLCNCLYFVVIGLLLFDIFQGGSRRYFVPIITTFAGLYFFVYGFKTKLMIAAAALMVTIPTAIILTDNGHLISDDNNLARGVGYRNVELDFLVRNIETGSILFGKELGYHEKNVSHGSKGVTNVGPRLHSIYYTILLNGGLVLLIILLFILIRQLAASHKYYLREKSDTRDYYVLVFFLLGWLISAGFDSPPDGLWPIGIALYWIGNSSSANVRKHQTVLNQ